MTLSNTVIGRNISTKLANVDEERPVTPGNCYEFEEIITYLRFAETTNFT